MNLARWIVPLVVAGLFASTTAIVLAQEAEVTKQGFVGAAASFDGDELVLEPVGDEAAAPPPIRVAETTTIRFPGRVADEQTAVDIQVNGLLEAVERGSKVAVVSEAVEGVWQALQITVLPAQPLNQPSVGAVVGVEDGVLIVRAPDGTTKAIQLGPQDPPSIGEVVTVFAGPPVNGSSAPPALTGLVRAEEVRQRLQDHLQQIEQSQIGLPEEVQAERIEELATLLENHSGHHLDILQSLLDGGDLPDEGFQGIRTALENARRGRAEAKARAEEARAKAGLRADRPRGPTGTDGHHGQP